MAFAPSFTFIDATKQKTDEYLRFEIRAQAALYSHKQAGRRIRVVADIDTDSRAARRRGRKRVKKQVKSSRRPVADKREVASPFPLESELLAPYSQPSILKKQDWIDEILHHYFSSTFPSTWPAFDLEPKLGFPMMNCLNWMRYIAMQDPAFFCLQACAAAFLTLPTGQITLGSFLWLRGQTISQLNMALYDPERRCSSLTIFMVLQLACYEAFSGELQITRDVHVPGLARMLRLRGGEAKFDEGLPRHVTLLSRWYAEVVTQLCGTERLLSPVGVDIGDVAGAMRRIASGTIGMEILDENHPNAHRTGLKAKWRCSRSRQSHTTADRRRIDRFFTMATMELEPTFKFIDVSKAKSDDAVKYEIRVRAAFHGYKHAHRIHPVSGRRIGPRIVKRTGKARNKKQASRRDNHSYD
ncbi:hypothetical protein PRZ48_005958 [Zasmidium cellare]|uniref:Uncharacterized protein n=1 Tax=Zasmidium cellare TaxID=395010 RepID=A0ABR0EMU0_ZASCE|nr:hypothetical protein PRZ48_005958 [Zasmidium cellare]